MNISTFSAYDPLTGLFDGSHFIGTVSNLPGMLIVKPNTSYIMGEHDKLSQRVDLTTGEVVDYIPPQPAPSFSWDAATKRWAYVASAAELLHDAQESAMKTVNESFATRLSWVRIGYPDDEVSSWSKQEGEARAWTANNAAPTPLLTAIAAARGVPLDVLAGKVIQKADLFAAASGALIGARQHAEDRIGAAATPADVEAIISQLFPPP